MSLYNMIMGKNPLSKTLLGLLGLEEGDFGRFRDTWIEREENGDFKIAVYTRCGGGNREDYAEVFESMAGHPLFVDDEDDSFDCTYCTFRFKAPSKAKALLEEIHQMKETLKETPEETLKERWRTIVEGLDQLKSKRGNFK